MKEHLLSMQPMSSALLSHMRIGNAVLSFKVRADETGSVTCIDLLSGHPIIVAAAMESIKTCKFRPVTVRGRKRALIGILLVKVSRTPRGLETTVLASSQPDLAKPSPPPE